MLRAVNADRLHFGHMQEITVTPCSAGIGEDSAKFLSGTEEGTLDGFLGGIEDFTDGAQAQALVVL